MAVYKVTDPLILQQLAKQGIDKDYVELWHDYAPRGLGKEYSPYAKFYRDLKSGIHIMAVAGLPMVNADGDKICGDSHNETRVGWERRDNKYLSKPNIFSGSVDGLGVELTTLNDQPTGAKKGDSVSWEPRLFLNGVEQHPRGTVSLLPTDPLNSNYHGNVLQWDYGICKRRIRVIEGRFRERWLFPANPNGDVRIKHDFAGNLKLRLGYARDANGRPLEIIVTDDEELIPAVAFAKAAYPVEIGASQTFYPDAHVEVSSVDGYTLRSVDAETWANKRALDGSSAIDDAVFESAMFLWASTTANRWRYLLRDPYLFDTSPLPDVCTITGAVFSLYGQAKGDTGTPAWNLSIGVYASSPASNTALIPADYNVANWGSTILSNAITEANWNPAAYNAFTLIDVDTDDFGYIKKDAVTKLGTRCVEEVTDNEPAWGSGEMCYVNAYFAEKGADYKPKLVVTYSVLGPPTVTTQAATGIGLE